MKTDRVYLCHIRDAIAKVDSYASVGKEQFMSFSHWQDAIIEILRLLVKQPKD